MMSDVTLSVIFSFGKDQKKKVSERSADDNDRQEGIEKWLNTVQKFMQSMHKK